MNMRFRSFIMIIPLVIMGVRLSASELRPDPDFEPPILPDATEAFAVTGYDAVQAVWMLRRAGFIQLLEGDGGGYDARGARRTIAVRKARVVQVAPKLYTIYINDEPLDWERSYLQYQGKMRNLRVLFSYRNQPHPFDAPLYLE